MSEFIILVTMLWGLVMMQVGPSAETHANGLPKRSYGVGVVMCNAIWTMGMLEASRWYIGLGEFHLVLAIPTLVLSLYLFLLHSWGDDPPSPRLPH